MNFKLTAPIAADVVIKLFELMRKDSKHFAMFEKLNGNQPFDVMKFTPADYVPNHFDGIDCAASWDIDIGNSWMLRVSPPRKWSFHRPVPEYMVTWYHDNTFCGKQPVVLDSSVPDSQYTTDVMITNSWVNIFREIRLRASITIREHKKYLHRPAFYDMLETELNIKTRKLK